MSLGGQQIETTVGAQLPFVFKVLVVVVQVQTNFTRPLPLNRQIDLRIAVRIAGSLLNGFIQQTAPPPSIIKALPSDLPGTNHFFNSTPRRARRNVERGKRLL